MKKIINSKYFKRFRRSFLKVILHEIESDKERFCCHVITWYRAFICWKDLKEVQENLNSEHLWINKDYSCDSVWFFNKQQRISFLKECISKIN